MFSAHLPTGLAGSQLTGGHRMFGDPPLSSAFPKTQLVVTYNDHAIMYYKVGPEHGWKIDNASRCLVIGKFPRTYIPLDQVRSFNIENY